jgi:hypothetical protein
MSEQQTKATILSLEMYLDKLKKGEIEVIKTTMGSHEYSFEWKFLPLSKERYGKHD